MGLLRKLLYGNDYDALMSQYEILKKDYERYQLVFPYIDEACKRKVDFRPVAAALRQQLFFCAICALQTFSSPSSARPAAAPKPAASPASPLIVKRRALPPLHTS